jgi:hypothetical protein
MSMAGNGGIEAAAPGSVWDNGGLLAGVIFFRRWPSSSGINHFFEPAVHWHSSAWSVKCCGEQTALAA